MADGTPAEGVETPSAEGAPVDAEGTPPAEPGGETPPAEAGDPSALGDAGKKALDAMKSERNQYRDDLKALRAEFDSLKAAQEGREAEHNAALEAQRVKDEALAAANERILKADVRAAAAGKLNDPADALRYLDLSSFEVNEDGEADSAAIEAAISELIETKPYLAAQGRKWGSADGGARKDASLVAQIDRAELARMSPDAIEKARREGRLNDLLGITS